MLAGLVVAIGFRAGIVRRKMTGMYRRSPAIRATRTVGSNFPTSTSRCSVESTAIKSNLCLSRNSPCAAIDRPRLHASAAQREKLLMAGNGDLKRYFRTIDQAQEKVWRRRTGPTKGPGVLQSGFLAAVEVAERCF